MTPGASDFVRDDVERAADAETAALQRLGVGAGDSVGWLALNSLRGLALLAACQRLGARFVPLNWRLAAPELAAIAGHADLQHLLHDDAMAPLAADVLKRVQLPRPRAPGHQAGDCLLVYTSGTTGEPKGAIHTVAGMQANIAAAVDAQALGPRTRALAVLPTFHVGGLCIQVLPTLAAGGRVRLLPRFDPGAWLLEVAAWRPTTSLLVPAVMKALIDHSAWDGTDLSSLAFVNSGSQIVPLPLIQAFHARGVPVAQVYGSTETGPVSVVLRPQDALAQAGRAGRPALGVQLRLEPDGEVLLKGPNLMRRYHRSADTGFDAEGWFHSGDLACRHDDGFIEIVGRSKELIISGGENIHPAEIENLLAGHPGVAECACVGVPDPRWGEVPVLALVARPGEPPDSASVQALLAQGLAGFKRPRRIVWVDALPRTALGKVQRDRVAALLA